MNASKQPVSIAVLDDYQGVALQMADWSALDGRAKITIFKDHLSDEDAVVERLLPFDVVCVMRERTPLKRPVLSRLPNLKLIASTGRRNAGIDMEAAAEFGIEVSNTGYSSTPTIELTWALILASARNIAGESNAIRNGDWQQTVGSDLAGKTLGIIGLGNIGSQIAKVGIAFGMNVIAWSQNLTAETATASGAQLVSKEELLKQSDFITIHIVLSPRSIGLIAAPELAMMKPTARLINTSRGPIVVEADLRAALEKKQIAGAAVDVFDTEPLPAAHPMRNTINLLATPHIGYVTRDSYERFYGDNVAKIIEWLDARK